MSDPNNELSADESTAWEIPPHFIFKAGTVLMLGAVAMILTHDVPIAFEWANNEPKLVGALVASGNLEVNRENLKGNYNGFGVEIVEGHHEKVAREAEEMASKIAAPIVGRMTEAEAFEIYKAGQSHIGLFSPVDETAVVGPGDVVFGNGDVINGGALETEDEFQKIQREHREAKEAKEAALVDGKAIANTKTPDTVTDKTVPATKAHPKKAK